ncbi:MAG: HD domain-containing protein [Ruminococcus sp.]|nr:HD domain-containing protein [Ruminococcus sp.]
MENRREKIKRKFENDARHVKFFTAITVLTILLAVIMTIVSINVYTVKTKEMRIRTAEGTAKMAADMINADKINGWLENGADRDYERTEKTLKSILDNSPELKYLYAYQIREDGCHVIFDMDSDSLAGEELGALVDFDKSFLTLVPDLLAGRTIDPIESDDSYGWLLTVYEPIYNSSGECVAYAGADVSMMDIYQYIRTLMTKIVIISAIFLIIVLVIGIRMFVGYHRTNDMEALLEQQRRDKLLIKEIVESFAKVIDLKDEYTNGHSTRVAEYTAMLTEELGYDKETVEQYYNIALMHDIGKIGIPDDVLNKAGKLSDEEFQIIKSHTVRGYEALKNISLMPELAIGAVAHHERPDGKGYPKGLKGDEIPRVAQIIAVADAFDAMYSNRPYRNRMNFERVVSIIKDVSGTQLASDVVDAFLRLVERGKFRAPDDDGGGSMEDISNIRGK